MSAPATAESDSLAFAARHFRWLWAVAVLLQQTSNPGLWLGRPGAWTLVLLTVVVLAILVIIRTDSSRMFAALIAADLAWVWIRSPLIPNHVLLMAMCEAAILGVMVRHRLARNPDPDGPIRDWSPALRVALLVVYGFAVLHKLNSDFLDPQRSGAVLLACEMLGRPALPLWGSLGAIAGTLLIEALIPILLLGRRTRMWGIRLGFCFHLFLALPEFTTTSRSLYAFAGMLWPLYLLFIPAEMAAAGARLAGRWPLLAGLSATPWARARLMAAIAVTATLIACAMLVMRGAGLRSPFLVANQIGFVLFLATLIPLAAGLIAHWLGRERIDHPPQSGSAWPAAIVGLVVLFNGMTPYLGVKTQTSWSMYSNLRTEGGVWNHLLLPRALRLSDATDDLVRVVATDDPGLRKATVESGVLINRWELRRHLTRSGRSVSVTIAEGGGMRTISPETTPDDPLLRPLPYLAAKLIVFRFVDPGPFTRCRH